MMTLVHNQCLNTACLAWGPITLQIPWPGGYTTRVVHQCMVSGSYRCSYVRNNSRNYILFLDYGLPPTSPVFITIGKRHHQSLNHDSPRPRSTSNTHDTDRRRLGKISSSFWHLDFLGRNRRLIMLYASLPLLICRHICQAHAPRIGCVHLREMYLGTELLRLPCLANDAVQFVYFFEAKTLGFVNHEEPVPVVRNSSLRK